MVYVQIALLLVSLGLLGVFLQSTLYHYRGRFRAWQMWVPVIETPIFALLFILSAFSVIIAGWTLYLSIVPIISGMLGVYYHYKGIKFLTGGFNLDNVLLGPPIILPLMVTILPMIGAAVIAIGFI